MTVQSDLTVLTGELSAVGPDLASGGEFLRGVLSGCGDCIKILDLDGHLQFMSDGGKRVMEVDDFAPLKGCPWPDFWAGSGNAQAVDAIARARAGQTARFQNAANTAKGTPRFWDVHVSPIMGANGKPTHILSISRDITEEHNAVEAQKAFAARQKFLTDELAHRLKNTMATVIAMGRQTFRDDAHKDQLAIFEARLQVLSASYDILNETSWSATSVSRVVETALTPYRMTDDRIAITGAYHVLSPTQALALALALNELATNALKYGALSSPSGKIAISWEVAEEKIGPVFRFEWRETGGPKVVSPTRNGFGSRVIQTVLAEDFGGKVDVLYEPTGFVMRLRAPP